LTCHKAARQRYRVLCQQAGQFGCPHLSVAFDMHPHWPLALLTVCSLLAVAAGRKSSEPATTLSRGKDRYQVVNEGRIEVQWGKLTAKLANNQAIPPEHAAGYNGIVSIHYDGGPSPFVPRFAGLNLEHVNNGIATADRDLQFEPRKQPMEVRRLDARTYELYQAPLPNTGLESSTRFAFREPHFVDVTFECIPRLDKFPYAHLNTFWASYIHKPEDMSIYFLGRRKGQKGEAWIQGVTPQHGVLATHRGAKDHRQFQHDNPFLLKLVFNESDYEYTRPVYYGRYGDFVWIVMFRERDLVRFTQSPSGGGEGNPAWDFQWFIDKPRKDKLYRMVYRAVYKRWAGRDDVLQELAEFAKSFGRN
jgi:hypothetical protein